MRKREASLSFANSSRSSPSPPWRASEHYWGYASQRGGGTMEYEVQHPQWKVMDAKSARFTGDAEKYYGPEFANILEKPPDSAFLAEGSAVTVFKGSVIDFAS